MDRGGAGRDQLSISRALACDPSVAGPFRSDVHESVVHSRNLGFE